MYRDVNTKNLKTAGYGYLGDSLGSDETARCWLSLDTSSLRALISANSSPAACGSSTVSNSFFVLLLNLYFIIYPLSKNR